MAQIRHDKVAKPKANRYFPYDAAELVPRVKNLGFASHTYKDGETQLTRDDRPDVVLENCEVECALGYQLCSFFRQNFIAQFSLPLVVPPELARKGMDIALKRLRDIDSAPWPSVREQQFVVYRAYLSMTNTFTLTRHVINGTSRSYLKIRAASQLSKAGRNPDNQLVLFETEVA